MRTQASIGVRGHSERRSTVAQVRPGFSHTTSFSLPSGSVNEKLTAGPKSTMLPSLAAAATVRRRSSWRTNGGQ